MNYPPRRPGRRDRWLPQVTKTKALPASTRLFLTSVLSKYMKADGKVSRPRKQLAVEFDCDERTVSRHITRAHEAGWLMTVSPGCLGHTAVYEASFPAEMRDSNVSQLASRCGTPSTPHLGDRNVPQLREMRDRNVPPVVVPNRDRDVSCDRDWVTCSCVDCCEWRYALSGDAPDGHGRDALALEETSADQIQKRSTWHLPEAVA